MRKYTNKKVQYNSKDYEIFWVTEFVQHIIKYKDTDKIHLTDLKLISDLAQVAVFIDDKGMQVGLIRYNKKIFGLYGYIIDTPKRCIIKSCHIVSDNKLLYICRKLGI